MSKQKTVFVCNNCGYETAKWLGKCPSCSSWNTFNEEIQIEASNKNNLIRSSKKADIYNLSEIHSGDEIRYSSGIGEFDRVLGSGIVPGSVILLSGDPGIGKSTLLLQLCNSISKNLSVLYVSGEESPRQIKLRALRLNINSENISIIASNDVLNILESIRSNKPNIVIIDSIQTMKIDDIASGSGSITQVREATNLFSNLAKELEIPFFIVGHVNKDGAIAGPKILEHMVDTVLYLEGDKNLNFRILKSNKNRFGSTNEIAVFEMNDEGLKEIKNPSGMLLRERPIHVSGSSITAVIEGSRPILAEIQALVSKSGYNVPRRTSNGIDFNRMAMLLAVLEKRCGYYFGTLDVYLNVVGGLHIDEPASDLAVILALISNITDKPIANNVIAFGEVGLAGEVRSINKILSRINEAIKMGFNKIILPVSCMKDIKISNYEDIEFVPIKSVLGLKDIL